jgi:alanine racemase
MSQGRPAVYPTADLAPSAPQSPLPALTRSATSGIVAAVMNPGRRRFLKSSSVFATAAAAAGFGGSERQPGTQVTASREPARSSFDPWIEISAANLRHNVLEVSRRAGGRPILAVIKNNAYGMDLVQAARLLEPLAPIAGFAVVKMHEAVTLRDRGVRKPLLLMGPFDEANLVEIAERDIMPMVYTPIGASLDRVSARLKKPRPIAIHVCVDTGIGRVGVPHTQAATLIRDLAGRKSVRIDGTMMTFAEHPELDREQIRRFTTLAGDLEREKIDLGRKHAASSFTLFQHADAFFDMVRPGMALYGVYSEQEFRGAGAMDLRPSMALRARIAYVKQLRKGESAGYSRAYVANDDVWLATLPVGHADGWPRAAAKGARVRIGDALYPVVASVSASHTIVEIGREQRVNIGDVATMWDGQAGSRPEDVSAACGASVYDLTMHLNPLLARQAT